jgi:hypothetical protein
MDQRYSHLQRKEETRRKIQLGGLIIKAGLQNLPTTVLLGLLLDASEQLLSENASTLQDKWKLMGELAFMENRFTQ